nr:hypothetical protein [Streptomyces apocyni]
MTRTTPPRPLDVEALFPELARRPGHDDPAVPAAGKVRCVGQFRGWADAVAGGRAVAAGQ